MKQYNNSNKESLEKLEKLEKLLDKSELELQKKTQNKTQLNSIVLAEMFNKAMDLYNIVSEEIFNVFYLEGHIQYQSIIQKLFRGFKQQTVAMLKYCMKSFDDKNIVDTGVLPNKEGNQESSKSLVLPKSVDQRRLALGENELSLSDVGSTSIKNLSRNLHTRQNPEIILNAKNIIKQDPNANPGLLALVESNEFKLFQRLIQIPVATQLMDSLVKSLDQFLYEEEVRKEEMKKRLDLQEKELENYLAEHHQMTKKIDEILLSKKHIDNLHINSNITENALRQVLKGLDNTKNKVNGVNAINLIDSDDDDDSIDMKKALNKEKAKARELFDKINKKPTPSSQENKIIPKIDVEDKICQYDRDIYHQELEHFMINPLKEKYQIELDSKIGELSDLNKRLNTIEKEYNSNKKIVLELKMKIANLDVEKNELIKEVQLLKNTIFELENTEQETKIEDGNKQENLEIEYTKLKKEYQKARLDNEKLLIRISVLEQKIKDLNAIILELQDNMVGNQHETSIKQNNMVGNQHEPFIKQDHMKGNQHEALINNNNNFHLPTENISENDDDHNQEEFSNNNSPPPQEFLKNLNLDKINQSSNQAKRNDPIPPNTPKNDIIINSAKDQRNKNEPSSKKLRSRQLKRSLESESKLSLDIADKVNKTQNNGPSKMKKLGQNQPHQLSEISEIKKNTTSVTTANTITKNEINNKKLTASQPEKELSPKAKASALMNKTQTKFDMKTNQHKNIDQGLQEKGLKNSDNNVKLKPLLEYIEEAIQTDPINLTAGQSVVIPPLDLDDNELLLKLKKRFKIKKPLLSIDDLLIIFSKFNIEDDALTSTQLKSSIQETHHQNLMINDIKSNTKIKDYPIQQQPDGGVQEIKEINNINEYFGNESKSINTFDEKAETTATTKKIEPENDNSINPIQSLKQNITDITQPQLPLSLSPGRITTDFSFIKDVASQNNPQYPYIQHPIENQTNKKSSTNILSALKTVIGVPSKASNILNISKTQSNFTTNLKIPKDSSNNLPSLPSSKKINSLANDKFPNELAKSHSLYLNKNSNSATYLNEFGIPIPFSPPNDLDQGIELATSTDFKPMNSGYNTAYANEYITISEINDAIIEDMYKAMERKVEMNPMVKNLFKNFILKKRGLHNIEHPSNNNLLDFEIAFEDFKEYVKKFTEMHQKCGESCIHLKRFFEKIGFRCKSPRRGLYTLPRTDLDKLPQIKRKIFIKT